VRQIYLPPVAVIEGGRAGDNKIASLLKITRPSSTKSKVLGGIARNAEVEAPSEI
jgi:hypothetical protein